MSTLEFKPFNERKSGSRNHFTVRTSYNIIGEWFVVGRDPNVGWGRNIFLRNNAMSEGHENCLGGISADYLTEKIRLHQGLCQRP
jgi:hypothetical protein